MPSSTDVMQSMLSNLYKIFTDVPDGFPPRDERDKFVVWLSPGMPFDGADLRFTRRGLIGEGEGEARAAEHRRVDGRGAADGGGDLLGADCRRRGRAGRRQSGEGREKGGPWCGLLRRGAHEALA